jgi:pimeloyl-ACP methyl ester carboxylesterase
MPQPLSIVFSPQATNGGVLVASKKTSRRDILALGAVVAASGSVTAATKAPAAPPTSTAVDRAFLRLPEGLVHYRYCGSRSSRGRTPLYLAHAGPGSSRVFEPLLPTLAQQRFAFAPDMLGNGDSAPPASETVDMAYYVDCAIRIMDSFGIDKVDFYGSHTGAQIGCQLAVTHPRRVRRLVLDGIPLFPEEFRQRLLAHYAPKVTPDEYGGHLSWAWNFVRDQSLHWPYFDRQPANRLANAVAAPAQLHLSVTDVLKALGTYHIAYRAAFMQDLRPLLPQLTCPVLVMASERDPLSVYLDDAAALVPRANKRRWPRSATLSERIDAVNTFLQG